MSSLSEYSISSSDFSISSSDLFCPGPFVDLLIKYRLLFINDLLFVKLIIYKLTAVLKSSHVNDKAVAYVPLEHTVVGRLDIFDVDQLDIRDDPMFRAVIQ